MYSESKSRYNRRMIHEAHRVFILCAQGHLEDEKERENKEESPSRDGRDVVSSGSSCRHVVVSEVSYISVHPFPFL